MTIKYTGRCLCGCVTYTAFDPPLIVAQCHCDECRRFSGAGHSVGAMFPSAKVAISGQTAKFRYQSATGSTVCRQSCKQCASPICGTNTRLPDHVTLTLGTMDQATDLAVQVVIFNRDRPHWDALDGAVSVFETQPDWTPDE